MPKKTAKKKKAFKAACHAKAKSGQMNNAAGEFKPFSHYDSNDSMLASYRAGYRA